MDQVAVLRRFNRCYTQRIGLLDESYLGTGRPLGPSRLLFEIGAEGTGVSELRRRLGLDSGYLSRLLRQLEQDELVTVARDPADGRQRVVRLSPKGRREWRRLDKRSEQVAQRLVDPLSERQRVELASALTTADRLLRAATVVIDLVDPRSPAARSALAEYFGELDNRFRSGFDPHDGGADTDAAALRPPGGAFLVMFSDHAPVGCGGLQRIDEHTGEIKRMWIHPGWRGLGLGHRLLARLEAVARDLGHTRIVLDTNETLLEAIAMYTRAGYQSIERYNDNPYAHHWFAKNL
ncbi:MAG TPA: bifunctional helix-turn-helix transcriptional regulator/GNAT family N-acetyltransferase [Ilumatobacteraceae bacterium]